MTGSIAGQGNQPHILGKQSWSPALQDHITHIGPKMFDKNFGQVAIMSTQYENELKQKRKK